MTRWSCEFAGKPAERSFRDSQYPSTYRQANFLFAIIGLVAVLLAVIDVTSLSDPTLRFRHIVSRGLVVLSALAAIVASRRWRSPDAVDAIAALFILAPMTMVIASALLRPGVNFQAPAVTIAVIMGTFMFVPTRLVYQCLLAGYSLGGGILIWGVLRTGEMTSAIILRFVITCVLAYMLGFYASRRLAASQRRQFAALQVSEENHRRLLAEIEERLRVEGELRQAKERVEEAMRAKADFLAVMSHEIRTPLNGILGVARLIAEGEGPPELRRKSGMIVGAGQTLMTLLNDLLDLSRLDGGRLALSRETFDLPGLVAEAAALMLPTAEAKGLSLECQIDPLLPRWAEGDPDRLRQVLLNYLSNALKFTERGGITVEARLLDRTAGGFGLHVSVNDTGIGVEPQRISQLFEPFTQGPDGLARRRGGAGLGLAIAKQLAELMGGAVGVEIAAGVGSRFWMTARMREAVAPEAPETLASRQPLSVLMVEDNELNRFVLAQMLSLLGHHATEASNRAAAVAAIDAQDFDLVLMDLELGGDSGLDAVRDIRSRTDDKARIPIVAVTAHAVERYRLLAEEAGVDGYLTKPITPETLAAELARLKLAGGTVPSGVIADAEDLSKLYEAAVAQEWKGVAAAADAGDMTALGRAAHALAGAAGVVGDSEVAELCCIIEETCDSEPRAVVDRLVRLLGDRLRDGRTSTSKQDQTGGEEKQMRHMRLLIADDHEVVRCGLRLLLGQMPNGEIVGEAADGLAVLDLARRLVPDVVVLDLSMPKMDGLDVIAALKKQQPKVGIVVLTVKRGSSAVTEALAAGADAYVLKDQSGSELIDAINTVGAGNTFLSRRLRQAARAAVAAPVAPSKLTPRERQVLKLLADGHSNQAVANILKIGSATVEKHRANLRRKLGVDSTVGLAIAAIREGLVEPEA